MLRKERRYEAKARYQRVARGRSAFAKHRASDRSRDGGDPPEMGHEHAPYEPIGEVVAIEDVPELVEECEAKQASGRRGACATRTSMPRQPGDEILTHPDDDVSPPRHAHSNERSGSGDDGRGH